MRVAAGLSLVALALATTTAQAAPAGGGAGGQVGFDSSGASSSGSSSSSGGYQWPERVISGNAVSLQLPLQIAFLGYMPRVRIGLQYDYQLHLPHWVHIGIAALLDRGDFETFKLDTCGFGANPPSGSCQPGTVAGFDIWAGYAYKWYLKERPYLVPYVRGSLGGGWWRYPDVTASRLQSLQWSGTFSLRLGGGARLFLLDYLALGIDVALTIGFTQSLNIPLGGSEEKVTSFLLGMEILPLLLEYRF
ncbi:MAG: hypothetical protein H6713_19435 [Myxococcales bacterium]|nr:hypothetical protein [Myxococcales bacterium]